MTRLKLLKDRLRLCECGCGIFIPMVNGHNQLAKFVSGHNSRVNHPMWKGGRIIQQGYYMIKRRDHPFCNNKGYVYEHRLVMEEYLGIYLKKDEIIHHINGDKLDNRIENLQIISRKEHAKIHYKVDMSNRVCILCGGKTFVDKHGKTRWYIHGDGYRCDKCDHRIKYTRKKILDI